VKGVFHPSLARMRARASGGGAWKMAAAGESAEVRLERATGATRANVMANERNGEETASEGLGC